MVSFVSTNPVSAPMPHNRAITKIGRRMRLRAQWACVRGVGVDSPAQCRHSGTVDSLAVPLTGSLRARLDEFEELPMELQLLVADEVDELVDRAALCLALPALGITALQRLTRYQEILVSVALRLARLDQAGKLALLDERLIRLYAAEDRAADDGCNWLNTVYAEAGSGLQVQMKELRVGGVMWSFSVNGVEGAALRYVGPDRTVISLRRREGCRADGARG